MANEVPGSVPTETSALVTDLYQLTMLQGYFVSDMRDVAVFEFFVRSLPPGRNFLVAAGIERTLTFLERFRFVDDEIAWLAARHPPFSPAFLGSLGSLRFEGDVEAVAEGTILFPHEPFLRVTAPLPQAQIVETQLINIVHYETLVASKAARMVLAAPDKVLVDFGLRRAHGTDAGLASARAAYLAGFAGTSNVLAGRLYDIPLYGTMAHSFIQAQDDEEEAFLRFARANPENVIFLLDTYDTEAAARKVVHLAPLLARERITIRGVRIDSGDLGAHARRIRSILDEAGLERLLIFASGDLDEHGLAKLMAAEAPIDGFGIGTRMNTSSDSPHLDCAYKLQEYAGRPRRKLSEGKATWPGRKQIYRRRSPDGIIEGDIVTLEIDSQAGEPLLRPRMRGGRRLAPTPSLHDTRAALLTQLALLPSSLRQLEQAAPYPVTIAPALRRLAESFPGAGPTSSATAR